MSDLVSFKWLKDQKMLREGVRPRCEAQEDIVPDFYEAGARRGLGYTRDLPFFSHDGVFVHEMKYYRAASEHHSSSSSSVNTQPHNSNYPAAEMLTLYG